MTSLAYVKEQRQMPFIKRGMRVKVEEQMGNVTSGNRSGNINVRFDDSKHPANCHPQWETVYYDKDGNVLADYRDKKGDEINENALL